MRRKLTRKGNSPWVAGVPPMIEIVGGSIMSFAESQSP